MISGEKRTSEDRERRRIERRYRSLMTEELRLGKAVSYVSNKDMPMLRLYKFKEAFALDFVMQFISRLGLSSKDYLFDPFAGMGTTLFGGMLRQIHSIGVDRLPVAAFVAKQIPRMVFLPPGRLKRSFQALSRDVNGVEPAPVALDVRIMKEAFDEETLLRLRKWKGAIQTLPRPVRDAFLLLFLSILEESSYTSKDGQFLRLKRDKRVAEPHDALYRKVLQAEEDIARIRWLFPSWNGAKSSLPEVILADARDLSQVPFARPPSAIITSPPYANRYDYTRSYCLELCFHFIEDFTELRALRSAMLRSHIESKVSAKDIPPNPVVREVLEAFSAKKLNNPKIPDMLSGYFVDMSLAIKEWARVLAPGAQVAMVVDNVRFEGELLPVDLVLSEIAEEFGFSTKRIIVARYKGNSSQQMRKYGRVPVRESIVIWEKHR
jgi:hypothetical protein